MDFKNKTPKIKFDTISWLITLLIALTLFIVMFVLIIIQVNDGAIYSNRDLISILSPIGLISFVMFTIAAFKLNRIRKNNKLKK